MTDQLPLVLVLCVIAGAIPLWVAVGVIALLRLLHREPGGSA